MKGYPKHIATKQDFINLLEIEEFKERAITDLQAIYETPDEKALRVVSGSEDEGNLITEEIDNPMPHWKIKGFTNRQEIAVIIEKAVANMTK